MQEDRTRTVTVKVLDEDGKEVIDEKTGIPKMTTKVETYKEDVTKTYDIKTDGFGDGRTIEKAYTDTENMAGAVTDYTTENIYNISGRMQTYSALGLNATQPNNVVRSKADEKIAATLTALDAEYTALVDAQKLLKKVIDELPDMRKKVEAYDEAFDAWDGSVNVNISKKDDSSIIERDYDELQTIKGGSDAELVRVDIEPKDVDEFGVRLEMAYNLMQTYREVIESIKYRGKVIFGKASHGEAGSEGIVSVSGFDKAANATPSGKAAIQLLPVHVKQTELDKYIQETWEIEDNFAGLSPVTDGVTGNNPELHNDDPLNDPNIAPLDKWFHKQFPDDLKTLAEAKGLLTNLKKMLNQLEYYAIEGFGEYTNVYQEDVQIADKTGLPSDGVSPNSESAFNQTKDTTENALQNRLDSTSKSAGSLFDNIDFATLATGGRDNLYATMYIMNMFSYETSALEGLYEMLGGGSDDNNIYKMSDGNRIRPGNADTYYNDLLSKSPSTKEGDWWNTKKTFTMNKTMTNKMLDKEHCISYGNEVEYILYGDTNEKNTSKIENTMMFTRFALNLAPVLSLYWNEDTIKAVSTTISSLTQGIIPVSLVKLIICLGVCAAESAVDMSYLKAGLPVAFYKKDAKNQLFIKMNLDTDLFEEAVKKGTLSYAKNMVTSAERSIKKDTAAFSYSDYVSLYLFVAMVINENDIYKRTADVIQLDMIENYPEVSDYQLKNAQTYYQISADIKVRPLMIEMPYAKLSGIEVPEGTTWNTFHYEAKRGY